MFHAYIAANHDDIDKIKKEITTFSKKQKIKLDSFISDEKNNKLHWEKRAIRSLVQETLQDGDTLIVFEASDIARSTLQVLEVMDILAQKNVSMTMVRYGENFTAGQFYDTESFLTLMKCIEGEFVTKRTTDALARRRAAGLPLGRPKGRKNKSRKLDKHRSEIKKYLALDINKASIAKLVGCHAQTLYNYLEDTNLVNEVAQSKKNKSEKAESK